MNKKIIAALFLFSGIVSACDQPFEPILEDDSLRFSISGFLDSAENEQWIRVVNLHQQNERDGTGFEGSVYLRDTRNDTTIEMQPVFRQYSQTRAAYNFTTDYRLDTNIDYQIVAVQEDGDESTVNVTTPTDFRDPEYQPGTFNTPPGYRIRDVTKVAEVSIRYQVLYPESQTRENRKIVLTDQVTNVGSSKFLYIQTDYIANSLRDIDDLDSVEITNCEFFVAKGGPSWIDFEGLDDNAITLPNGISNVNNGTGYLAAVHSRRVQHENNSCDDQGE